jgi:hypothetical protein
MSTSKDQTSCACFEQNKRFINNDMVEDPMYCLRLLIVYTIELKAIFFSEFGCLKIISNVVFIQENHEWKRN